MTPVPMPDVFSGIDSTNERDALTSRTIPTMSLSTATNPLTAPLSPVQGNPAATRFAVEGNAVITGGAGSLGLKAARALLEHGALGVALLDLASSFESSSKEVDALKRDFTPPRTILEAAVDVTSETSVSKVINWVRNNLGPIDVLCCFAGIVGCADSLLVSAFSCVQELEGSSI
jgi:sorbose reductase